MKKIILLTLCTLLLSGCTETTENDLYQEALSGCTMPGYSVYTHPSYHYGAYACMSNESYRIQQFGDCADYCDTAIDDYKNVSNYADASVQCLKLCMGE